MRCATHPPSALCLFSHQMAGAFFFRGHASVFRLSRRFCAGLSSPGRRRCRRTTIRGRLSSSARARFRRSAPVALKPVIVALRMLCLLLSLAHAAPPAPSTRHTGEQGRDLLPPPPRHGRGPQTARAHRAFASLCHNPRETSAAPVCSPHSLSHFSDAAATAAAAPHPHPRSPLRL